MLYKKIMSNGDVLKVMCADTLLWSGYPLKLKPKIEMGDKPNKISVGIDVPAYKKGLTKILVDVGWLYRNGCIDMEFNLSDRRIFGWKFDSQGFIRKYGTNEGVSGSPEFGIEIYSVNDEPIDQIRIDIIFSRTITSAIATLVQVAAEYVLGEW